MKLIFLALGWYFHRHYQHRVLIVGAYQTAKQLRKQGVDIRVARLLVAYRPVPALKHKAVVWS